MFIPAHYAVHETADALGWLARYPFGTLVTMDARGLPIATPRHCR